MGKRKPEKSEDEIRRKIKKLQERLAKTTNRNINSSPEGSLNHLPLDTPYTESVYCESPLLDTFHYDDDASPHPPSPSPPSPRPASPGVSSQPVLEPPPQPGTSDGKTTGADGDGELQLEEDILQLLGDAPKAETPLGPSIHKDVARRWQDILAKGLSKDTKESLLKEYLVPSNCDLLLAPALNPEVKAALPDTLVKRDLSLIHKQKQLGIALSALATVTEMVISGETSKQKILKPLSDACRILCDSHHIETKTRRNFVISSINAKLKDALVESSRDKLLFGENVAEKLKAAKTIQQSGEALKNAQKPRFQRTNPTNANRGRLNYVPQHRKTDNKLNDGRRAPNQAHRQPQNSNARRPIDRPLQARAPAPQRR